MHDVFHVSQLKKCTSARRAVASGEPRGPRRLDIHREANANSGDCKQSHPDEHHKNMQSQMDHHYEEEATWEREEDLKAKYPELFAGQP